MVEGDIITYDHPGWGRCTGTVLWTGGLDGRPLVQADPGANRE